PYRRLTLIETPIQFFAYPRMRTLSMETLQPEQVLLPEKGLTLPSASFKQFTYFMSRRGRGGRGGGTMSPYDIQRRLFRRFTNETFLTGSSQSRMMMGLRGMPLAFLSRPSNTCSYSLVPLYYSFVRHFTSDKWPIFNMALEFYLNSRITDQAPPFMRFISGLTDDEKANMALMKRSLAEILADPEDKEVVEVAYDVIRLKCEYLFAFLQSEMGKETFDAFLKDYLGSRLFSDIRVQDFLSELGGSSDLGLEHYFDSWLNEKKLPAFTFSDLDCYEILDQEHTRYQAVFKVSNPEPVDGIISVNFRTGGGGGRSGMRGGGVDPENERIFSVRAGEGKEIGMVLDEEPRMMMINTIISQNLPSLQENRFGDVELEELALPFEGERDLDGPLGLDEPGTVIVDNEDPGFEVLSAASEGYLKKYFDFSKEDEDEYAGIQFWNMPRRWTATTNSDFYGLYRHSAHYIRAGEGDNEVSWKAELPRSGRYDVYYHVIRFQGGWMRWMSRRGKKSKFTEDFNLTIHHDDGAEEVKLDTESAEEGWNLLGTFYFSQGPAKVGLSDITKGQMVYADAVKWVEHE
ncbi:MAG: hypothetical protein U9N45_06130, partial [Gemmatimonadota bacterium]|nr:hypothetical protein [Gemmatimonadota bacterium]